MFKGNFFQILEISLVSYLGRSLGNIYIIFFFFKKYFSVFGELMIELKLNGLMIIYIHVIFQVFFKAFIQIYSHV